jgi:L-amino acid N-acyltransferase YncA
MILRDADDADLAAVTAIYAHHVQTGLGTFEEVAPDREEIARRRADVLSRDLPWLVCEIDGRVAGYAYAAPFRTRSAYRYTVEDSVYVAADHQGLGVGRRLLEAVLARCEALGVRQATAVIGDSANAGSIGLHKACGFAFSGVLRGVGFKHGRWVDVVLMQRTLGDGEANLPNGGGWRVPTEA